MEIAFMDLDEKMEIFIMLDCFSHIARSKGLFYVWLGRVPQNPYWRVGLHTNGSIEKYL